MYYKLKFETIINIYFCHVLLLDSVAMNGYFFRYLILIKKITSKEEPQQKKCFLASYHIKFTTLQSQNHFTLQKSEGNRAMNGKKKKLMMWLGYVNTIQLKKRHVIVFIITLKMCYFFFDPCLFCVSPNSMQH